MIHATTPMEPMHKEMEKKRKAMQSRLSKLGTDNPVVKLALKNQQPPMEDTKWKNWEIVDELVRAARKEYFDKENGSMNDCVANLAKALTKLAMSKSIDNNKNMDHNNSVDEDY